MNRWYYLPVLVFAVESICKLDILQFDSRPVKTLDDQFNNTKIGFYVELVLRAKSRVPNVKKQDPKILKYFVSNTHIISWKKLVKVS